MKKAGARPKDFASSLTALEAIVRELERGDLPLEQSLELFEEGVRLSRECQDRLNEAERRIEVLLRDGEGRPMLGEFGDAAELERADATDGPEGDDNDF